MARTIRISVSDDQGNVFDSTSIELKDGDVAVAIVPCDTGRIVHSLTHGVITAPADRCTICAVDKKAESPEPEAVHPFEIDDDEEDDEREFGGEAVFSGVPSPMLRHLLGVLPEPEPEFDEGPDAEPRWGFDDPEEDDDDEEFGDGLEDDEEELAYWEHEFIHDGGTNF